jgi:apolipoprotein N-acyltransferase
MAIVRHASPFFMAGSEAKASEIVLHSWVYRIARYGLLVLGGGALAACFIDERLFPAAWIGLLLLVYLIDGQPANIAFRRGMVFGLVVSILGFHWVPEILSTAFGISYVTAGIFFLFFAICDAFHFGLAAYLAARFETSRVWASLIFPVCFIGLEFVWIRVFPWRLAHSQIAWTSFIQIAEFVGVYGVGLVMAWTASIAAMSLKGKARRTEVFVGGSVLLASIGFGAWRIGDVEDIIRLATPLHVALVQTDVRQQDAVGKLQTLSRQVAQQVDLICWPESSAGTYDLRLSDFRSSLQLSELSRVEPDQSPLRPLENPRAALLCAGKSYISNASDKGPYHVTAFLIDSHENILGRYHKRILLPLGEYVPGERWLPWLTQLLLVEETISPGASPAILDLKNHARIGALICYEDMLDSNVRASVQAGAEVLVVLANGAAFGKTLAMKQHQQLAHFRAIENRRYLVRCSTTGSTAVISPTGKLVAKLPPHQDDILLATVYPLTVTTMYTRIGNVVGYLCLAGIGSLILWRQLLPRRGWCLHQPSRSRNSTSGITKR